MTEDGRRRRGDTSRRAILERAADDASLRGLDGITIGVLAAETGVSKSNVATLFGSKLELQLATIEAARERFVDAVIAPALAAPRGLQRLWAIIDIWLTYSETRVFAGGCFFRAVSTDAAAKDDAVRQTLVTLEEEWTDFLSRAIREASAELPRLEPDHVDLFAFEITAMLDEANRASLLHRSTRPYDLARRSARARLAAFGAPSA